MARTIPHTVMMAAITVDAMQLQSKQFCLVSLSH
jgi:hypothetical protein